MMPMFDHYFALGLRSLRRRWGLTTFVVMAIGFGVAAFTTSFALFQAASSDPIPWKSAELYVPVLDSWATSGKSVGFSSPSALSYVDAINLLRDGRADAQAAMYQISAAITPRAGRPFRDEGYAVSSQFFSMFDVPFQFGTGWGKRAEDEHQNAVVISQALNKKLFGGTNSVGEILNIEGHSYSVVGVIDNWDPKPRFFDLFGSGGFTAQSLDYFLPIEVAANSGVDNSGNMLCSNAPVGDGRDCVWISYMVQINHDSDVKSFEQYLDHYSHEAGLGPKNAAGAKLYALPDWMKLQHVVPGDASASLYIAIGLLFVCLVNATAIMLARFMSRASEIGVRRALGASRAAIYSQFLVEGVVLGSAGGVLSIFLVVASSYWMRAILPQQIAVLVHVDFQLLLVALLIAQICALISCLYPAFRAASVHPSMMLKGG